MTVALALLLAAIALGVAGPAYLRPAGDPRVHPALALSAWMVTLLAAGTSAVTAAAVLLLPDPSVPDGALGMAVLCWEALSRGSGVPWLLLVRLAVGISLLVPLTRVGAVLTSTLLRERTQRRGRLGSLRAVARVQDDVWWIPSHEPVAFSIGSGRRGVVVASTGLERFDPEAVAAVLEHERAHVRGRHHLAVALARAAARAMPWVPLCRAAPGAVGVLCELAADAASVRRCGHGPVTRALQDLASAPDAHTQTPRGAVGFDAFPAARLSWLTRPRPLALRGGGPVARGAATAAALLPALLPGLGSTALVLAACLGS